MPEFAIWAPTIYPLKIFCLQIVYILLQFNQHSLFLQNIGKILSIHLSQFLKIYVDICQIRSFCNFIQQLRSAYNPSRWTLTDMKESRLQSWTIFIAYEKDRVTMKLSPMLEAMMDYCEYVIHAQFDKNTKSKHKHKKKREQVTEQFKESFKTLDRDEKLGYYLRYMKLITSYFSGADTTPVELKGTFLGDVYSRSYNLKIWKHKKMKLDREKHILFAEKDNKIKSYALEDYLLRKSKNKEYYCFVLEAINNKPHQKSRTVHLGFKQETKFNEWIKELLIIFDAIQWNFICAQMKKARSLTMSESMVSSERSKTETMEDGYMSKSAVIEVGTRRERVMSYDKSEDSSYTQSIDFNYNSKSRSKENEEQFFSEEDEQDKVNGQGNIMKRRETIIESIAKLGDQQQIQKIQNQESKKTITTEAKQNIFSRIMPEYKFEDIFNTVNYGVLFEDKNLKILGHLQQPLKLKMFINFQKTYNQKIILNALTQTSVLKQQNNQIEEMGLKTLIKSQNSAMMYLKIKAYNKLYRPRDFIFLRHVFSSQQVIYMIDKSIENISYPPFTTIVRGDLCILWAISHQNEQSTIIADINMNNQGYLNDSQNVNLVLKYLKGFANLDKVIDRKIEILQKCSLFSEKWNIIAQNEQFVQFQQPSNNIKENQDSIKLKKNQLQTNKVRNAQTLQNIELKQQINGVEGFKKKKVSVQYKQNQTMSPLKSQKGAQKQQKHSNMVNKSDSKQLHEQQIKLVAKYSHMEEQKGEIDIKQAQRVQNLKHMTVHGIKRQFDKQGFVIISNSFTKTKYILTTLPKKSIILQQPINGHPIWKGEWIHDTKVGGIIFVNQKKIEDQKGVLKFILTKIGKNLLSGKSVLNISLPVDIFCAESNLQRLVYSLTYAPILLDTAAKLKDPLQRLKKIIAFGISNSPLYLNMQKPFNPILGQTFQCWIDGCPVYAEQISHHPPIAAILYEGRGFRMTAQLESKVELHMNSGCGTNDGIFRIQFDDGLIGCYVTPGGEVSGLTYGDRKFNMVGKSYYWIQSEGLFLELVFNPAKKGFFSVGKQEQPIDYFQGQVCKVKTEFWEHFHKKRRGPNEKQIAQKLGKVHGIWNKQSYYENEPILNINTEFPVQLEYEANPLPSDANWREDIAYRRILQTTRAQAQKQRLEVFQRKDRKLREANPNHHHHHKK